MTTQLTVLSRDHIKFIRSADTISFHWNTEAFPYGSNIESDYSGFKYSGIMRVTNKFKAELSLDVAMRFRMYGPNSHQTPNKCFAWIGSAQFTESWKTIASLLKPGDVLVCEWVADSNGYTRVASFTGNAEIEAFQSLHTDYMRFIIVRNATEKRKTELTFELCHSICPDNSARMIQH